MHRILLTSFGSTKKKKQPCFFFCLDIFQVGRRLKLERAMHFAFRQEEKLAKLVASTTRIMCQARSQKNASNLFDAFEAVKSRKFVVESRTENARRKRRKSEIGAAVSVNREEDSPEEARMPPPRNIGVSLFLSFCCCTFSCLSFFFCSVSISDLLEFLILSVPLFQVLNCF